MKVLTVCRGGHVRSVGLKHLLWHGINDSNPHHDVLACGIDTNSKETIDMLCVWADYIVVLTEEFKAHIPVQHHTKEDGSPKMFCYDVGRDRFHNPKHPELQEILSKLATEHGFFV